MSAAHQNFLHSFGMHGLKWTATVRCHSVFIRPLPLKGDSFKTKQPLRYCDAGLLLPLRFLVFYSTFAGHIVLQSMRSGRAQQILVCGTLFICCCSNTSTYREERSTQSAAFTYIVCQNDENALFLLRPNYACTGCAAAHQNQWIASCQWGMPLRFHSVAAIERKAIPSLPKMWENPRD